MAYTDIIDRLLKWGLHFPARSGLGSNIERNIRARKEED
jgi:hypothetical protein